MTREEAIERLNIHKSTSVFVDSIAEAIDMAIEALSDRPTDEWCSDCKEYDHEKHCCPRFNRVIRTTLNEVVYCKDCKWEFIYKQTVEQANADDVEHRPLEWCSYGERKNK